MKLFRLLSSISFVIVLFTSCSKDVSFELPSGSIPTTPTSPTTPPTTGTSYKVKTYTEEFTAGTYHTKDSSVLTYDANDRLLSIVSVNDPTSKFAFAYPSSSKFTMDIFGTGKLTLHTESYLNNFPYIDSTWQYNDTKDTSADKYIYNANGQLVMQKSYLFNGPAGVILDDITLYTYDATGNLTQDINSMETNTYTYYSGLVNTVNFMPYIPKVNGLIKTQTNVNGGVTTVVNYTYTFDSLNRVILEKAVDSNNTFTSVKSYTYY